MKKNWGLLQRILNSELKWPKKSYFLFYEDAIYIVTSKVLYLSQFFAELDQIRYKSRATQGALAHQISSWSDEKWQRYGTCSVSQGRRPQRWSICSKIQGSTVLKITWSNFGLSVRFSCIGFFCWCQKVFSFGSIDILLIWPHNIKLNHLIAGNVQSNPIFWNRLIIFGALARPNKWFNQQKAVIWLWVDTLGYNISKNQLPGSKTVASSL